MSVVSKRPLCGRPAIERVHGTEVALGGGWRMARGRSALLYALRLAALSFYVFLSVGGGAG